MSSQPPSGTGDTSRPTVPGAPAQPPQQAGTPGGVVMADAAALDPDYLPNLSFWQQPFVKDVLPFLTSLVLHLGLILFLLLLIGPPAMRVLNPPKEQVIIPESDMPMDGVENGSLNPGAGNDPSRRAEQDKFPDIPKESRGWADKPGTSLIPALVDAGGSGDAEGGTLISAGAGSLGAGTGSGLGRGNGSGMGEGKAGGVLAPFGIPGGGSGLPRARFLGSTGVAKRIVYVCDGSGSMSSKFEWLRSEMGKSINALAPVQSFNVVFFQNSTHTTKGYSALNVSDLLVANPVNKSRASAFLTGSTPYGETNPIPALELAFGEKPDLIYLLTDGEFGDYMGSAGDDQVVDFCKQKTADGKTKINTIALITRSELQGDDKANAWVRTLETIAKNSGGKFKIASQEDE